MTTTTGRVGQSGRPVAVRCPDPSCGAPMVERLNTQTSGAFLGCSRFPDCRETRALPLHIRLRRDGATPLPGWEDL